MRPISSLVKPTCKIIHLQIEKRTVPFPIRKTFIQNVQDIIEENIDDENFGIQTLCKAIGISRSQLHNKIKAATGVSTSIYIRNLRLARAYYFLNKSDMNVSEVAYEVGFKDASYFSRLFLEKYGVAPSKIRQSMQTIFLKNKNHANDEYSDNHIH